MSTTEMIERDIAPIELPEDLDVCVEEEQETADETTEQNDVLKALEDAVDGLNEPTKDFKETESDWHTEIRTTKYLLQKYRSGEIKLPLCQRMYVWSEQQRLGLLSSVRTNKPCNSISIGVLNGQRYLVDGLQRVTSLMLLSNSKNINTADQIKVLKYKIDCHVIDFNSEAEMVAYFNMINGGVALAAVVKERSRLPEELVNSVLSISGRPFFRKLTVPDEENGKSQSTSTFAKSHHPELISMGFHLAAAGVQQGDNKAKNLVNAILNHKEEVLSNVAFAIKIAERVEGIYDNIDDTITKRSMNANYIGTLGYIIANYPDFTDAQIIAMTETIFRDKNAVKWYSATTGSSAASAGNCAKRLELMVNFLRENGEKAKPFDNAAFVKWIENHGEFVHNTDGTLEVEFSLFERLDRVNLFTAMMNKDADMHDKVVYAVYNNNRQSA